MDEDTIINYAGQDITGPAGPGKNLQGHPRSGDSFWESKEIFRAIFENTHDGILLADAETKKFLFGNDMICRMLGCKKEELKQLGVPDIHPEEDLPEVIDKFRKIERNELAMTKGLRVKRRDGSIFYADIGASPLRQNGKNYVIGIFRDITERVRAENEQNRLMQELKNAFDRISGSEREWHETFDNITDPISIHDRDFNIIKINKSFAEYFGSPEKVINKKCYNIFHDCNMPVPNCPHKKTLSDCINATEEVHDPKTGKTFRVSTFPYYSPDGSLFGSIHIARDITMDREKELGLIMNESLAALGQMASGIAHEINNPLASMAGCAEGLLNRVRKGKFDPDLFENYLNIIEEEIVRCKDITGSILSFVRKTTHEKKEINIPEMIDKTLQIISFQGRMEKIGIVRKYSETTPSFYGSEGELRQVVLAIITNALDAMDDLGTITVETGTLPPSLAEGDQNEKVSLFINISDSGPGIQQEDIERIFKPFFTTKSDKGGTGLGLPIAHKIISSLNGDISVHTEEGKGTTFRISLPT